jgi:hypothetical protein
MSCLYKQRLLKRGVILQHRQHSLTHRGYSFSISIFQTATHTLFLKTFRSRADRITNKNITKRTEYLLSRILVTRQEIDGFWIIRSCLLDKSFTVTITVTLKSRLPHDTT